MLMGTSRFQFITPILQGPSQFTVLVFTYKAIYSLGLGYLKDNLLQYELIHALCSSEEVLLCAYWKLREGILGGCPPVV